jgi:branched-chain amino acid transport system ATP-binding protein
MVDEPTEGLSPIMIKTVKEVLEEIGKSGISILLVEHNFKLATSLAKRVFIMGKAHIGFSGTTEELDASPQIIEKYLEV